MISPRSLSKSAKKTKTIKQWHPGAGKKTPSKTELQYFFFLRCITLIFTEIVASHFVVPRNMQFCHPFNLGRLKIYPLWLPLRLLCCDFSSAHFQVVVRIKFPDRLILQAFFRPMEKGIPLEFVEGSAFHVLDLVPFLY